MIIKEITKISELHEIRHLVANGCLAKSNIHNVTAIMGYLSMVLRLKSHLFYVVYDPEDQSPKGYVVASLQSSCLTNECHIDDVYFEGIPLEICRNIMSSIEQWALQNECERIISNTDRPEAFQKAFGFTNTGRYYIIKQI